MTEKPCEFCHEPIKDPRQNQKYHPECYRLIHNQQCTERSKNIILQKSPILDKTCPICRQPYQTRASRNAATCKNVSCRGIWSRKKRKETWASLSLEERKARNQMQYQKYTKHNPNHNGFKNDCQTLECICPGCRKRHLHEFYPAWIGHGTPRIGCSRYPACIHGERLRGDRPPIIVYNSTYDSSWECGNGATL
jgi:hypothetical protein